MEPFFIFPKLGLIFCSYCLGSTNFENASNHEVALICTQNEQNEMTPKWFIIIVIIFRMLEYTSIVLIVITIVIYIMLPEIQDLQGHCTIHFLVNYGITYFIVNILFEEDYELPFSFTRSNINFFYC